MAVTAFTPTVALGTGRAGRHGAAPSGASWVWSLRLAAGLETGRPVSIGEARAGRTVRDARP